jgi:hypothetical protein
MCYHGDILFSLLMLMFSISSLLMIDNSIMLLISIFCILNGPFHGNLNLSPLILVGLDIHLQWLGLLGLICSW